LKTKKENSIGSRDYIYEKITKIVIELEEVQHHQN